MPEESFEHDESVKEETVDNHVNEEQEDLKIVRGYF